MNTKRLLIVVVIIVLAAGAIYFFVNKKPASQQQGQQQTKAFNVEKKDIDPINLPKGFASDFPMPAGAKIKENSEATTSDGRVTSTRSYTTQQTADNLNKLYKNYFTKLGWTDFSKKGDTAMVFRRSDDTVLVTVTSSATERIVEVTLTQAAAK